MKVFRADKFSVVANSFVDAVLGDKFLDEVPMDMKNIVEKDSAP